MGIQREKGRELRKNREEEEGERPKDREQDINTFHSTYTSDRPVKNGTVQKNGMKKPCLIWDFRATKENRAMPCQYNLKKIVLS